MNEVSNYTNKRIVEKENSSALHGVVRISWKKLFWVGGVLITAIVGGVITISFQAVIVFLISTIFTLCFGHSLGMHRKLIHQSYQCPKWLEYINVHLGVLVGLAGPKGMIETHDMRDWAQRQSMCHAYYSHQSTMLKDCFWQIFCEIKLKNPPEFVLEKTVQHNTIYYWMEKTWMLQQLPWAILLYYLGGIGFVIWGVSVRVSISIFGHWLIGYYAHNSGEKHWHVEGAAVQGYNINQFSAFITMGESWHNNHHAFPGSALLGLESGEVDPGWWVLCGLKKLGLVWKLKLPSDLDERPELKKVLDVSKNPLNEVSF